ncbi:hypothetical protein R3P38DRAFT_3419407 [Favolaschia claudopus]|uniref:Transmembrane protein n=1 Tax=Favolaschia claudopus TaxID=2862362 RepID=A0AAW0EIV1_9AGAR
MFRLSFLIPFIFYVLSRVQTASAAHRNVTIDDTDTTHWTFVGSYHAVAPTSPCHHCRANPDPDLVYNRTWHDGELRSGSFQFQGPYFPLLPLEKSALTIRRSATGSVVYIVGIDFVNPANVTFILINSSRNGFHYYGGSGYVYNSLFFSATDLDSTVQHTVTWFMEKSSVGGSSALLDYAMVTIEDAGDSSEASSSSASAGPTSSDAVFSSTSIGLRSSGPHFSSGPAGATDVPSSPPKKLNSGAIAGAAVGALAVLVILGALLMFRRRRTRGHGLKELSTDSLVEPYRPADRPLSRHDIYGTAGSKLIGRSTPNSTSTVGDHQMKAPQATPSLNNSTSDASASQPVIDAMAMEERGRHLEDFVAASQPPRYHE